MEKRKSNRLTQKEKWVIAEAANQILNALVRETEDPSSDTYVVVNCDAVCLGFSKFDWELLKSGLSKI